MRANGVLSMLQLTISIFHKSTILTGLSLLTRAVLLNRFEGGHTDDADDQYDPGQDPHGPAPPVHALQCPGQWVDQ